MTEWDPLGQATLDLIAKMRTPPDHPVGSEENPFVALVPAWYEKMCLDNGETPQEVADRVLRPVWGHVVVEVVR